MAKSFSYGIAYAKVKALGEGATFYASDLGILGGTISGLQCNGVIEKTGRTKKYFVNVYDNHFVEAEVYEWRVHDRYLNSPNSSWIQYAIDRREKEFKKFVDTIIETAEMLKSMGLA
jgi:hypothetical protein